MADPVFFEPARSLSAAEIAELTGARLVDPAHGVVVVRGIAPATRGGEGRLVFVDGRRNAKLMDGLSAAAILCTEDVAALAPPSTATLVTPKPQWAFALIGRLIYPTAARPQPLTGETGISPRAVIADDAHLEDGVVVEAGAVIGPGVAIGSGTVIAPNAVIGRSSQIGRDCFIGPGVSIQCALIGNRAVIHSGAQIGREGFGFVPGPRGAERQPQIGRVIIQDDVEIGANTCVDRGAMDDTIIGEGTKIDNLVQIAHNVEIGRFCLIAANVGLSGTVKLGDGVQIGGGAGVSDHVNIGTGARLAAGAGLMHDVPAGERWGGAPAMALSQWFRHMTALRRLGTHKGSKGGKDGE